ncbi:hypothetical protein BH24GEM3_BH24GEM3_18720 [soil metagenome]
MPRFLFALLLLASFWPAAARVGTEVHVRDRITPLTSISLAEAVRVAGAIELLLELERNGSSERSSSSSRDLPPHSGGSSPSVRTSRLSDKEALGRQSVVLPRLAHLPYFATPPPHDR